MVIRIITNIIYFSVIFLIILNTFTAFSLFCFHLYIIHVTKNINLNNIEFMPENIFTDEIIESVLNENNEKVLYFFYFCYSIIFITSNYQGQIMTEDDIKTFEEYNRKHNEYVYDLDYKKIKGNKHI